MRYIVTFKMETECHVDLEAVSIEDATIQAHRLDLSGESFGDPQTRLTGVKEMD